LRTVRRRRLTARGIQHTFEWFYVDGAVAPTTGERFVLELLSLNAEALPIFVDAFAHTFPDSLNILLLDNRGAHTAQRLQWPANARYGRLPPYGPELNPIDRLWRELQDDLTWLYCPNLDARLVYVGDL
jgi:transposase